jgi:hypothetical protein
MSAEPKSDPKIGMSNTGTTTDNQSFYRGINTEGAEYHQFQTPVIGAELWGSRAG